MKSSKSPTARTMKLLRECGFECGVVERYNSFTKISSDLFGFIDIVAIGPNETVGVQATSGPNHSARVKKIMALESAVKWLDAGNHIWVVSWKKKGRNWAHRVQQIAIEEFKNAAEAPARQAKVGKPDDPKVVRPRRPRLPPPGDAVPELRRAVEDDA